MISFIKPLELWQITKKSFLAWFAGQPFRKSAVIAYYAIFSMPALLVIVIALAGLVFGREAVSGEISWQISKALSVETAKEVEAIVAKASVNDASVFATIVSVVTLLVGCTGVFDQLQYSLNEIWEVKARKDKGIWHTVRDRLFSFGIVISIGFLLMISLLITTLVTAFSTYLTNYFPDFLIVLFEAFNFVLSFGVICILFALMFRILPDAQIDWKDVWIGATVTSLLFVIGKFLLGIYFGTVKPESAYGTAGSVVLIMLWVSYSSLIVLFGAEFTKQYRMYYGRKVVAMKDAKVIRVPAIHQQIVEKRLAVEKTTGAAGAASA